MKVLKRGPDPFEDNESNAEEFSLEFIYREGNKLNISYSI